MTDRKTFVVTFCPDEDGYIVAEASHAFSFAMVPANNQYYFGNDKARAREQVRRLHAWQDRGNTIETRMIQTPGRFERVADVKYGVAW